MARTIRFKWEGTEVTLGLDEAGSGRSIVLLQALSSISTRAEMRPLFDRLAPAFRVRTVDWPGFGDLARPRADWSPEAMSTFLNWFLSEIVAPPHAVIAAGHAATYALYQAANRPGTIDRFVLIAPTWRGPLPTMMGGQCAWFVRIRQAVDLPGLGSILYRLNVSRPIIAKMAKEHVYSSPDWLGGGIALPRSSPSRMGRGVGMPPFALSAAVLIALKVAQPFSTWRGAQKCQSW